MFLQLVVCNIRQAGHSCSTLCLRSEQYIVHSRIMTQHRHLIYMRPNHSLLEANEQLLGQVIVELRAGLPICTRTSWVGFDNLGKDGQVWGSRFMHAFWVLCDSASKVCGAADFAGFSGLHNVLIG